MHLTNWKARRAGGRITVTGTGEDGNPAKIVGVDFIEPRVISVDNPHPTYVTKIVAQDKNGALHTLAID